MILTSMGNKWKIQIVSTKWVCEQVEIKKRSSDKFHHSLNKENLYLKVRSNVSDFVKYLVFFWNRSWNYLNQVQLSYYGFFHWNMECFHSPNTQVRSDNDSRKKEFRGRQPIISLLFAVFLNKLFLYDENAVHITLTEIMYEQIVPIEAVLRLTYFFWHKIYLFKKRFRINQVEKVLL